MEAIVEEVELKYQEYVQSLTSADPGKELSYGRPEVSIDAGKDLFTKLSCLPVGNIKELDSFWDRNFYISTTMDQRSINLVMKVVNETESANLPFVTGLIEIMLYLIKSGINCPKPCKVMEGEYVSHQQITDKHRHAIYVQTFIEGIPVGSQADAITPSFAYQAGAFLGKMDNALKGFNHLGFAGKRSIFGLECVANLKHHLHEFQDERERKLLTSALQTFDDKVIPNFKHFQRGIIHGDFNPNNVIAELDTTSTANSNDPNYTVTGVIDFGDTVYSCYVFELGLALCHFMMASKSKDRIYRISVGEQFKAGYESEFSLNACEQKALDICITGRAVQLIIMCGNELKKQPDNGYIRSYIALAWELLTLMDEK